MQLIFTDIYSKRHCTKYRTTNWTIALFCSSMINIHTTKKISKIIPNKLYTKFITFNFIFIVDIITHVLTPLPPQLCLPPLGLCHLFFLAMTTLLSVSMVMHIYKIYRKMRFQNVSLDNIYFCHIRIKMLCFNVYRNTYFNLFSS